MAYMSQENKKSKEPIIKSILKKYGLKGSLSVRHHSTLVLNIREGKIDFIKNCNDKEMDDNLRQEPRRRTVTQNHFEEYIDVNEYWYKDHFTGEALQCLGELIDAMMVGNHNNSEPQVDYFDVGWYIDVKIGNWDRAYRFVKD